MYKFNYLLTNITRCTSLKSLDKSMEKRGFRKVDDYDGYYYIEMVDHTYIVHIIYQTLENGKIRIFDYTGRDL